MLSLKFITFFQIIYKPEEKDENLKISTALNCFDLN